jgi:hypothetical protein
MPQLLCNQCGGNLHKRWTTTYGLRHAECVVLCCVASWCAVHIVRCTLIKWIGAAQSDFTQQCCLPSHSSTRPTDSQNRARVKRSLHSLHNIRYWDDDYHIIILYYYQESVVLTCLRPLHCFHPRHTSRNSLCSGQVDYQWCGVIEYHRGIYRSMMVWNTVCWNGR